MKTITTIVLCLLMFSACKKKDIVTKAIQTSTEGSITFWTKGVSQTFTYTDSTPVYDRSKMYLKARYYSDKGHSKWFNIFFSNMPVDSVKCPLYMETHNTPYSLEMLYENDTTSKCIFISSNDLSGSSYTGYIRQSNTKWLRGVVYTTMKPDNECQSLPNIPMDSIVFDLPFVKR